MSIFQNTEDQALQTITLYGCEMWSLTFSEELLQVLEKKMLGLYLGAT
jgi:hypothetical protein